ncbi:MAG: metallophosphoesterase [Chloroflexota bacterium]
MTRRQFLAGSSLALAGVLTASTLYLVNKDQSQELVVERVTLPIRGLAPSLEGFTIAQLSDFHLYPFTQPSLIKEAVVLSNALKPDLVVMTGDYVWHELEAIYELAPILVGLNAKHGVYAAMGNHDLWTNVNVIKAAFDEVRLPTLINQGVTIHEGAGSFYLAGLDDGWSGEPDLAAALAGSPAEAPVVLLLHEPDLADEYSLHPRIALQLSGHAHGGQIRFPRRGAMILPYLGRKYDYQLYRVNEMWLYSNPGIGVTNEPLRINCPPEITEITLVRA